MNTTIPRAALATPLLLLVAACGAAGSGSAGGSASTSSGVAADARTAPAPASAIGKSAIGSAPGTTSAKTAVAPLSRAIVSTGQISLHAAQVLQARDEVLGLVASWGGIVASEQTTSDDHGQVDGSQMTLRVPTAQFDAAMRRLAQIGHVDQQSSSSDDVTTQVIDVQARIRSGEKSIRAIEALLGRATQLGDIVTIESDLARRQADLDSLVQQSNWLDDQTSSSTITLSLTRSVPPVARKVAAHGFLAGLGGGWSALGAATVVALTVVGAVLPFVVLVALVGVPLWLVVRRRRPPHAAPPAEA